MNDAIRKAAAEVKRLRQQYDDHHALMIIGKYNPRMLHEHDEHLLRTAEMLLCSFVLAALEEEQGHDEA